MEVAIPVPATDFHFDSNCSSPYISAPSSPKGFSSHYSYYSAPTSPSRASAVYRGFDDWEEKTATPKATQNNNNEEEKDEDFDFAFDFSGHFEKAPLTAAEELFDKGKIRTLRPVTGFQSSEAPKSPSLSPMKSFRKAFSPKQRKEANPFAIQAAGYERERGRERKPAASNDSSSSRRATRSLSPLRVSDGSDSKPEEASFKGGSKKWRLKDFLLFRSASEGRASDKYPLRKYGTLPKKEDTKNSSFRSTTDGSVSGSKRGPVSAHERHYTANRAVAEEMKRKTLLPYRQGLWGCLGFNPAAHGLARGFRSITRG